MQIELEEVINLYAEEFVLPRKTYLEWRRMSKEDYWISKKYY